MKINLANVDSTPKVYIQTEGHYTLKCIGIDESKKTNNGNTIMKIIFQDKNEQRFIEDIVITPNTLFRVKQISEAFGFEYDDIDTSHFLGMYLVAWLVKTRVKNSAQEYVEVLKAKSFVKSKLPNTIPPQGTAPTTTNVVPNNSELVEIDINEDEIPF